MKWHYLFLQDQFSCYADHPYADCVSVSLCNCKHFRRFGLVYFMLTDVNNYKWFACTLETAAYIVPKFTSRRLHDCRFVTM